MLYFLGDNDKTKEMNEKMYEKEENLQTIINNNPELLLRDRNIDGARLMIVESEFPVAAMDGTVYSLDHLLLDQDATPVLVEDKRVIDTRIKREVVAQMFDYASRVSTWDVSAIRESFIKNNDMETINEYDNDKFWMQLATNLKAERVKLVFVADRIPDNLKSLIEFMDRNMSNMEVYGVEVRQFKADNVTLLSTGFIGNTASQKAISITETNAWDLESFTARMRSIGGDGVAHVSSELYYRFQEMGLNCEFGSGPTYGNLKVLLGSKRIFQIGFTKHKCMFEIELPKILSMLNGTWTKEQLVEFILRLPNKLDFDKYVSEPKKYLYFYLQLLELPENLEAFINNIKDLCEMLGENKFVSAK